MAKPTGYSGPRDAPAIRRNGSRRGREVRSCRWSSPGAGFWRGCWGVDKGVIILVRSDDPDRKPQLYACPQCGGVHSPRIYVATDERAHQAAREAAENCYNCKTHNDCSECGAECPKGWTACEPCRYTNKLAAAEEVPDDGGPYCAFDGDTYYYEMDEAVDAGLEWVSPCNTTYPKIDPDDVLDGVISDMHDEASVDDLEGVEAFYQAVKAFNDAQTSRTYWGDSKRKIRVPLPNEVTE